MLFDLRTERLMLRRVGTINAAAHHRDGAAACRQRPSMGSRIDAASQPADDRKPRLSQFATQLFRDLPAPGGDDEEEERAPEVVG